MEMGAEPWPTETLLNVTAEPAAEAPTSAATFGMTPSSPVREVRPAGSALTQTKLAFPMAQPSRPDSNHGVSPHRLDAQKRKGQVLDHALQDGYVSPRKRRPRSQAASSSSDALFYDDPSPAQPSASMASAPEPRVIQQKKFNFADAEVAEGPPKRMSWTAEEEERLIEGHERYGNRWEKIRTACKLQHRLGTQLRDKYVNLLKSQRVTDSS